MIKLFAEKETVGLDAKKDTAHGVLNVLEYYHELFTNWRRVLGSPRCQRIAVASADCPAYRPHVSQDHGNIGSNMTPYDSVRS
jgi:hypothetical protein